MRKRVMGITINLDVALVEEAKRVSVVEHRSAPKQIEYWANMGRIAEQNPELSFHEIKDILIGLQDVRSGNVEEYDPENL